MQYNLPDVKNNMVDRAELLKFLSNSFSTAQLQKFCVCYDGFDDIGDFDYDKKTDTRNHRATMANKMVARANDEEALHKLNKWAANSRPGAYVKYNTISSPYAQYNITSDEHVEQQANQAAAYADAMVGIDAVSNQSESQQAVPVVKKVTSANVGDNSVNVAGIQAGDNSVNVAGIQVGDNSINVAGIQAGGDVHITLLGKLFG